MRTSTPPAGSSPGGEPLWRRADRWLVGLALGALAAWVNTFQVSILTPETPYFAFGWSLVLIAFVLLGPGPGLSAAFTALAFRFVSVWTISPGAALGGSIYVLEALWAWFLYRRTRSLFLAVTLFWITVGWLLDLLVYVAGVGLAREYVVLLLVKQFLNGVANAAIAELVVVLPIRDRLPASWAARRSPAPLASYAFSRIVVLVMLPVTLVAFQYARVGFAGVLREAVAGNAEMANSTAAALNDALGARHRMLETIARGTQSPDPGRSWETGSTRFLSQFEDAYAIVKVDEEGVVVAAQPEAGVTGISLVGLDLATRRYFARCRGELAAVFSDLVVGRAEIRSSEPEEAFTICEPLVERGRFSGALVASIDPRLLIAEPGLIESHPGREITLMDRTGLVLSSDAPNRPFGVHVSSLLIHPDAQGGETAVLEDFESPAEVSFYPPPSDDPESRLAIDLRHASFRPVRLAGWGVLVSLPAAELHRQFLPTAYLIVGMFSVLVLFLFVTVKRFTRRISDPFRAAAGVARLITGGGRPKPGAMSQLAGSDLSEVLDLSDALVRMEEALAQKALHSQKRQEDMQLQLLQAQKMEAIGLLAGGVAHDFNNTLTPILGYADLGLQTIEHAGARRYFEKIETAACRAKEITFQLLAFGRKQVLEIRSISVAEAVRRSEKLLGPLLRENIRLDVRLTDYTAWVLADATQLHQILVNLAVNAQDAMPRGGVLTLRVERVDQAPPGPEPGGALEPRPHVLVTVADTGEGISQSALPHIFEPFYTTKGPGKGTGLGLATVHGIVSQHGGVIDVQSQIGEGTTFFIYLPEVSAGLHEEEEDEEKPVRRSERGTERVLVVEDDEAVRLLIQRMLAEAGYDVATTGTAEEALELFAGSDYGCDLLVSDVVLPGMNGRELYDALEAKTPGLPVLFVSGYGHDVLGETGLPPGAQLLMKPFTSSEITTKIRQALGQG